MALGDLDFISFLKSKMHWHQARQRLLAQNVANADTPAYRPHDLKPMTFADTLAAKALDGVDQSRTHRAHITGPASLGNGAGPRSKEQDGWEITPAGNAVVLEEQMMKVAGNQFEYQLASSLYTRSIGLIRTALGRSV